MGCDIDFKNIHNVEEGDLILIKNNSVFNSTYVECIVERKTTDINILKLKWKYNGTDVWDSKYVDFSEKIGSTKPVLFIEILEKNKEIKIDEI